MTDAPRLVILDLAGTTIADTGHIGRAFAEALAACGVTITDEQLLAVRGASKREAISRLLPQTADRAALAATVFAAFRDGVRRACDSGTVHAMPGVEGVMRQLKDRRVRVALNTGFDRELTDVLLTAAMPWARTLADAVVCGDDVEQGRPAPDMIVRAMALTGVSAADVVMNVGDTTLDLEAGHRAGVRWNVAVLSGAHNRARLERAPHTHIIDAVATLPELLTV